jgi:hypothetical protein
MNSGTELGRNRRIHDHDVDTSEDARDRRNVANEIVVEVVVDRRPARPRGARLGLRPTLHLNYGLIDLALIQLGPAGHDKLRATMAAYFPRIASFMPPTALRIFPLASIADGLSGEFFDLALGLLSRTFDALLIHGSSFVRE